MPSNLGTVPNLISFRAVVISPILISLEYSESAAQASLRALRSLLTLVVCVRSRGALDVTTIRAATLLGDTLSSPRSKGLAPPSLRSRDHACRLDFLKSRFSTVSVHFWRLYRYIDVV